MINVLEVAQRLKSSSKVMDMCHSMRMTGDGKPLLDKRGNYLWAIHPVESHRVKHLTMIHYSVVKEGKTLYGIAEKNNLKKAYGAAVVCRALAAFNSKAQ